MAELKAYAARVALGCALLCLILAGLSVMGLAGVRGLPRVDTLALLGIGAGVLSLALR
jgi:hypothetical protein